MLKTRKIKTKQKDLASGYGAMGIVNHRPTLIIAETVSDKLKKENEYCTT
ncbi:hypothetical protein Q2T41_18085 [Maribacter confluentis]|uniref:Uncharacterized protein n=1 Tax=Maribacter confluentis TaxID=1656093 RepID=A0ABT8RUJ1_9FLAO|nr:hypothetical protein [Maribacter confluentis]MDO1514568.1 hypothetical protein [Maribacter confluentis]